MLHIQMQAMVISDQPRDRAAVQEPNAAYHPRGDEGGWGSRAGEP